MPLPTSFADTFQPRRRSQSSPVGALPFAPSNSVTAWNEQGREMRLSREQARHCRLWNFIAIDSNATKASEDIPHVGYETADGEKVPDPKHPLAQLFRNVNPVDWWQSFAHEMFMMWGLYRRVVIWMNPNGFGVPAELWVVPTPWAEPKPDRDGQIRFWEITPSSGGVPFKVDAEEILCAQAKHPNSKTVPLSPTEAGAEWIVSSEIVERARHDTYEHGPLQSMMLEIDPEHHQGLTPELLDAIGEKFMARYQGWHKAGRPIVQPPGVKAVPWSVKPNEMLTGETADQLRDNVLALHKTPRSAVGISADLNRASIWGAEHNWYEHALNPMRRFLAGALTEFLASRFEEGLLVWYDDLIPRDVEQERAEIELDFKLGAITPDERRTARGYEPLGTPAAQQTYRPSSQVPLDTPVQQQSASPKEPRDKGDAGDEALADDSDEEPAAGKQSQSVRRQAVSRTNEVLSDWERTHNETSAVIERRAAEFLRKLSREVGARWDAGARTAEDLCPSSIFRAGFSSAMRPAWQVAARSGVGFEQRACGIERIKQDVTPSIRINIPPRMQREIDAWVNARDVGIWRDVEQTTRDDIAKAITEGVAAGKGMREIRKRVTEVVNDKTRAATISQTEATGAMNAGAQILRDHQGIKQKQWFATFDGHTRATHSAAQGQITDNAGEFVVGGYRMRHPGDSSYGAPPSETIRCRCCATGYVDTSVKVGPTGLPAPQVVGAVSHAFEKEIEQALGSIPDGVRRFVEVESKVEVVIGERMTVIEKQLAGVQPRGWPEGSTWDQAEGAYFWGEKRVVATEFYMDAAQGKFLASSRVPGALRHEYGHAFDEVSVLSKSRRFQSTYHRNRKALTLGATDEAVSASQELLYFLQDGDAGPQEVAAEGFGIICGGGASPEAVQLLLEKYFPDCMNLIRGEMDRRGRQR